MEKNGRNKLEELYELGQSPWYDNIDRRLIDNGALKSFFDRGIVGVTSNPTIFEKAINASGVYDEKIKALRGRGMGVEQIYDELTADDVRDAADLLQGIFERTQKQDGFVSIEVLPRYAQDPQKTVEYARMIFKKVNRPNVMIKVPGTPESFSAIQTLIREGICVNVTLLFSVSQYKRAAAAYIEGLNERVRDGRDLGGVSSVASVFISRIDSKADSLLELFATREDNLEKRARIDSLKGKIAVMNAKMIYQKFKEMFGGPLFVELKMRGALAQRPLWASTGTKNPQYSDVKYVDELIGPMTVNTMPHQTVEAFLDHGAPKLTVEENLEQARDVLKTMEKMELDLELICEDAQKDGVRAFVTSFDVLMESLRRKMS